MRSWMRSWKRRRRRRGRRRERRKWRWRRRRRRKRKRRSRRRRRRIDEEEEEELEEEGEVEVEVKDDKDKEKEKEVMMTPYRFWCYISYSIVIFTLFRNRARFLFLFSKCLTHFSKCFRIVKFTARYSLWFDSEIPSPHLIPNSSYSSKYSVPSSNHTSSNMLISPSFFPTRIIPCTFCLDLILGNVILYALSNRAYYGTRSCISSSVLYLPLL